MVVLKNKKIKKKNKKIKKINTEKNVETYTKHINFLKIIIQNTVLYVQKYKTMDIIDAGELNICIHNLEINYKQLEQLSFVLKSKKVDYNQLSKSLDEINEEIKTTVRLYGTGNIEHLLELVISSDYIEENIDDNNIDIFNVVKKYIHPINYKIMSWREKNKTKKKY